MAFKKRYLIIPIALLAAYFWDYILKFLILGFLVLSLDTDGKENYRQLKSCNWWPDSYVTINNITLRIPRKERPSDSTDKYERFEETKCGPAVVDTVEIWGIELPKTLKIPSYNLERVTIYGELYTHGWSNKWLKEVSNNLEKYSRGEFVKLVRYSDYFLYIPEEIQQPELTSIYNFTCSDIDSHNHLGESIGRECRSFAKTNDGLFIYYVFTTKTVPDLQWIKVEEFLKQRIQDYIDYGAATAVNLETNEVK